MQPDYKWTRVACYIGYVTQAITINLATLFFVIFQDSYSVSFALLGQLVLITFVIQILVDLLSIRLIDRIGYRTAGIAAHVSAALGLVLLGILPRCMPNAYLGILISAFFYAIGGGLTEVIISPLMDSLPGDAKASSMSLLHSFYSWGLFGMILLTTALLSVLGQERWYVLPFLWAVIPLFNIYLFCRVPIPEQQANDEETHGARPLLRRGIFWLFILLMICSGASEQAMCQWASLFAEKAIGVTKTVGDILGPCGFAVFMALGRTAYGVFGQRIRIAPALLSCAALTVGCYALTIFCGTPIFALIGCAVCGLGVSLMWPGVLSLSSERYPAGGNPMFAMLALAGDLGCSLGPWLSGIVSDAVTNQPSLGFPGIHGAPEQIALRSGMLASMVFPVLMVLVLLFFLKKKKPE